MDKQERAQRRDLYKLVVARSDILAALEACKLALKLVTSFEDPLYAPLFDSIVVNYSKPFSENKPFGPLSRKWATFDDSELQELHQELVDLRNKVIAHSDLESRKMSIVVREPIPGLPLKFMGVSISSIRLPVSELGNIKRLCMDLGGRLNVEADSLLNKLVDFSTYPTGTVELEFE